MTALVIATANCTTYRQSRAVATGGGVTILVGAALVGGAIYVDNRSQTDRDTDALGMLLLGFGAAIGGAMAAVGGLVGMGIHAAPDAAPTEAPPRTAAEEHAHAECVARRSAALRKAHGIADPEERTRALLAAPTCDAPPK